MEVFLFACLFRELLKVQTLLMTFKRHLFANIHSGFVPVLTKFTFPYVFWLMLSQAAKSLMRPLVI